MAWTEKLIRVDEVEFTPAVSLPKKEQDKLMRDAIRQANRIMQARGCERMFGFTWSYTIFVEEDLPTLMVNNRQRAVDVVANAIVDTFLNGMKKSLPFHYKMVEGRAPSAYDMLVQRMNDRGFQPQAAYGLMTHKSGFGRSAATLPGDIPKIDAPAARGNPNGNAKQKAEDFVCRMVSMSQSMSPTATEQYAFLEQTAVGGMKSADAQERLQGKMLHDLVMKHKKPWAKKYVAGLLERFKEAPTPPGLDWKLGDNIVAEKKKGEQSDFATAYSKGQQAKVQKTLDDSWNRLRAIVNPKLLGSLPCPKIVVHPDESECLIFRKAMRAFHTTNKEGGGEIHISPRTKVPTVVHEFGHHMEEFGPIDVYAAVMRYLDRHSREKEPELGSLRSFYKDSGYKGHEVFREGHFLTPYITKYYPGGSTEVLSMSIERLANTDAATDLYLQDPDLFMTIYDIIS